MTFSRHLTLLIISLFSALVTSWGRIVTDMPQAGKAEVMGVLQMGKKALAVSDAHVMLVYLEDGERPDTLYRVSSKGGSFSFKGLPPGRVYIKATKVGMNDSDGVFDLTEGKNMVVFQMSYSSEYLEASSVVSNVPLMKILKDTTIFNAAAVKTFDGESALALLEQFPGFEVRGSSIKFMGKPIARTYVNGVQIFGDKAITAFNELYADEVSQVRVYEETRAEDLRRGIKHGQKEQVLDIKTKIGIQSLSRIGLSAAGGLDGNRNLDGNLQGRYVAGADAQFYSERILGGAGISTDNIGQQFISGFNGVQPLHFAPLSDYSENLMLFANIERNWKDRRYGNSFRADYRFEKQYSRSAEVAASEFFRNELYAGRNSLDSMARRNLLYTHSLSASVDLKDTPLKSILAKLDVKLAHNSLNNRHYSLVRGEDGEIVSDVDNSDRNRNLDLDFNMVWTNNDLLKIRPMIKLNGVYKRTDISSWSIDTLESSYLRRNLTADATGDTYSASIGSELEILLNNDEKNSRQLSVSADISYDNTHKVRMTVDNIDPELPQTFYADTYDYTWKLLSANAGQRYSFGSSGGLYFYSVLKESIVAQVDMERIPEQVDYRRMYLCIDPSIRVTRNLTSLKIDCSTVIPSIEQTRDRLDISNPLYVSGGNPGLKAQRNIHLNFDDNLLMVNNGAFTLGYYLDALCSLNPIRPRSYYFEEDCTLPQYGDYVFSKGTALDTYDNVPEPLWNANLSLSATKRLKGAHKKSVNISVSTGYESSPCYVKERLVHQKTANAKIGGTAFLSGEEWRVFLGLTESFNNTRNDVSERVMNVLTSTFNANFKYSIAKDFTSLIELRGSLNNYLGESIPSQSVACLNFELDKAWMKGRLRTRINAVDILNKGSVYSSSVSATRFEQRWKQSYGRYFMISAVYIFRERK